MFERGLHFATRHWRGHVALLPTCLLTCLALRLALDAAARARPAEWPLAAAAAVSLAGLAVFLWQVVGGVRAVARAGRDFGASLAGAGAVLATALLFLNAELDSWAARGQPGPPPPAPAPRPFALADAAVRITGRLDLAALARLEASFAAYPGLRRIELDSDGGHIPAARAMAQRIMARGADTRAIGFCASACTLVFMAGRHRSLAPGAALGFHAYRSLRPDPLVPRGPEEARDRAWLAARGVAPEFLARAYATPHDRIWRPDREALRAAGVLSAARQ